MGQESWGGGAQAGVGREECGFTLGVREGIWWFEAGKGWPGLRGCQDRICVGKPSLDSSRLLSKKGQGRTHQKETQAFPGGQYPRQTGRTGAPDPRVAEGPVKCSRHREGTDSGLRTLQTPN